MVYTHYAPAPNEVDLVNDAFDPRVMVEGASEGAKPSETQPHSDPLNPSKFGGSRNRSVPGLR